jgi:hypothetical protein
MPATIQGFTRFRKWQLGKQSAFGTAVAATRRMAWRGTPEINPNWTDVEDIDVGSIDPVMPAYRTQTDITTTITAPVAYNDLQVYMGAAVRGGVSATGAGAAKTWTHTALSTSATTLDYYTGEWGDDVTADGFRFRDGIAESLEFSFDEGMGPWQVSADFRFGYADAHVTATSGLEVGSNLIWAYGADTALYINDTSGAIGTTQITDALHSATIRIENEVDQKRFANGSNSRFALDGYGLSGRTITATLTFAKASSIVAAANSETVDWLNADPVNRYLSLVTTSPSIITGSTPYSWTQNLSGTWRTRSDGELGNNSTVTLEMRGRYDAGLGYAYRSVAVNGSATNP